MSREPFPWKCHSCYQRVVYLRTISHSVEIRMDGKIRSVYVPALEIPICSNCGEKVFTEAVDEQINEAAKGSP